MSSGRDLAAIFACACGVVVSGCAGTPPPDRDVVATEPGPGAYRGTIPCADCAGIELTLWLRADARFFLRQEYLGVSNTGSRSFVDRGFWSISESTGVVTLDDGTDRPRRFAPKGPGEITMLDISGGSIESTLNYSLRRLPEAPPFTDTFDARGEFVYFADAATFTDCVTKLRFPVAMEADYLALERTYLRNRPGPAETLLVSIRARLTQRPREAGGTHDVLIVERFDRAFPGEGFESDIVD